MDNLTWKIRKAEKEDQFVMHIKNRKSMFIFYVTDIVTMSR